MRGLSAPSKLSYPAGFKLLDQEVQRAAALQALFENFVAVVSNPCFIDTEQIVQTYTDIPNIVGNCFGL